MNIWLFFNFVHFYLSVDFYFKAKRFILFYGLSHKICRRNVLPYHYVYRRFTTFYVYRFCFTLESQMQTIRLD